VKARGSKPKNLAEAQRKGAAKNLKQIKPEILGQVRVRVHRGHVGL
jgi:hypothetical protein